MPINFCHSFVVVMACCGNFTQYIELIILMALSVDNDFKTMKYCLHEIEKLLFSKRLTIYQN